MDTYYVTFGQKYCRTPFDSEDKAVLGGMIHPYNGHKDGWVEVNAINLAHATAIVKESIGDSWSCIYSSDLFEPSLFSLGCLYCIYNRKGK